MTLLERSLGKTKGDIALYWLEVHGAPEETCMSPFSSPCPPFLLHVGRTAPFALFSERPFAGLTCWPPAARRSQDQSGGGRWRKAARRSRRSPLGCKRWNTNSGYPPLRRACPQWVLHRGAGRPAPAN